MTTTIPNNHRIKDDDDITLKEKRATKPISQNEEFLDPNMNHTILLTELRERIVNLQYDLNNIRDPEVLGFATKVYIQLKNNYFDLMTRAIDLEHDMIIEKALHNIAERLGGMPNE